VRDFRELMRLCGRLVVKDIIRLWFGRFKGGFLIRKVRLFLWKLEMGNFMERREWGFGRRASISGNERMIVGSLFSNLNQIARNQKIY
jgi:hypothetical protein